MTLAAAKSSAVAAWNLDEASGSRADQVGSSTLTDNNTVGSAAGMFGNAADFEADNSEYLSVADNAALSTGDVDFMLRCWIRLETDSGFPVIWSRRSGVVAGQLEYILYYDSNDNKLKWYVGDSGECSSTATLSTGTWYLIHAWHDSAANEIGLSINAGTADTLAHSGGAPDLATETQIGAATVQSLYWDGLIDDPVFLKGYILDATERTEDYNSGSGVAFADWDAGGGGFNPLLLFANDMRGGMATMTGGMRG